MLTLFETEKKLMQFLSVIKLSCHGDDICSYFYSMLVRGMGYIAIDGLAAMMIR